MSATIKEQRAAHANELIDVIARHGRRFFHNQRHQRNARIELRNGRVYFIDDYSGKAIYTHRTTFENRWRGFSHGGTLRSLIEQLRDYIMNGTLLSRWVIAPAYANSDGDIWGYGPAAEAVRAEAWALPLFAPAKAEGGAA